jgi:hypothetical protein
MSASREHLEIEESEPPKRESTPRPRRFDYTTVRTWLLDNPGVWARVVGEGDRPFTEAEMKALKSGLDGWYPTDGRVNDSSVTVRPRGGGYDVYVKSQFYDYESFRVMDVRP